MRRILAILMLSGVLGMGPGFWTQLHLATCSSCNPAHAAVAASSQAQIRQGWSHNTAACPICMILHAAIVAPAAASFLNPHLPISYCPPAPRTDILDHRRISTDCRGPPASPLIAWA